MNTEMLQTFLAIYRTGSITRAASMLYLSQSTVSERLQQLEAELNKTLVIRVKGQKNIELTDYGEKLLPIAQQSLNLYESALRICDSSDRDSICISATGSTNNFALPCFYKEYLNQAPQVDLKIQSNHSWEIFDLVEKSVVDVGVVNNDILRFYDHIVVEPLFSEEFVIVHPNNAEHFSYDGDGMLDVSSLDPYKEIVHFATIELKQWHEHRFPKAHSRITSYESSLLENFLTISDDSWTIVPESVGRSLIKSANLVMHRLHDGPPERKCNLIYRQDSLESATISNFIDAIKKYFHADLS